MSTSDERREQLLHDPDILIVEPHRVYCNRCKKWLKLDEVKLYAASVWRCHKSTKSHNSRPTPPSSPDIETVRRVAAEEWTSGSSVSPLQSSNENCPTSTGEVSRSQTDSSSASTSLPRLKLKIPNSIEEGTSNGTPQNPLTAESSEGSKLQANSRVDYSSISGQSTIPMDYNSRSNRPSESPVPQKDLGVSPELSAVSTSFKIPSFQRSASASVKESGSSSNITGSKIALSSPEHLDSQRKVSYKRLIAEPYIGNLEPYRALCTLCNVWVTLSSRTPYSYGVWKGHVRKMHSVQTSNADEEDDTASNHSQEEGTRGTSRPSRRTGLRRPEETIIFAPHVSKKGTIISRNHKSESAARLTATSQENMAAEGPGKSQHTNVDPIPTANSTSDIPSTKIEQDNVDILPSIDTGGLSGSLIKAVSSNIPQNGDDERKPNLTPQKQASLIALGKRRQTMLDDPDAAIVESRRVKCGICDRWIKGSNTQEYSLHHWVKHRKKCARNSKGGSVEESQEVVAARKAEMEKEEDIQGLEAHRALCGKCGKWVKLCGRTRYSMSHWVQHKKTCPRSVDSTASLSNGFSDLSEARRLALSTDPDILELQSARVVCKHCRETVSLSETVPYMPDRWLAHKAACSEKDALINARLGDVARLREQLLRNDKRVVEVDDRRVHCGSCDSRVDLDGSTPYSLSGWESHLLQCGSNGIPTIGTLQGGGEDDHEASFVEQALNPTSPDNSGTPCDDILPELSTLKDTVPDQVAMGHSRVDDGEDIVMKDLASASREVNDGEHADAVKKIQQLVVTTFSTSGESADDRLKYLLQQLDILSVETHRVLCGRCLTWVALEEQILCDVSRWLQHKSSCPGVLIKGSRNGAQSVPSSSRTSLRVRPNVHSVRQVRPLPKGKGKTSAKRGPSPMALPPLPTRPRWPSEDERKQQFLDDPNVLKIEPHRLLCKNCNCWIRLHPIIRYSQSIWPRHKLACKNSQTIAPGDPRIRAKTQKEDIRREMLEEDPYVMDIGPHRVTCKACGTQIRLDTIYKYEGSHWRAHRARCAQIPFTDRTVKRRKIGKTSTQESPRSRDAVAMESSSDSDDSDASSAPRPRPMAVFTAPLDVNPLAMFGQLSPPEITSLPSPIEKGDINVKLQQYLCQLAKDLNASDRLSSVINDAGDYSLSHGERFGDNFAMHVEQPDSKLMGHDPNRSLTPESASWVPQKRTREDEEVFDMVIEKWTKPPTPRLTGRQRSCNLGREGMPIVE